jgi:hypothetical protein
LICIISNVYVTNPPRWAMEIVTLECYSVMYYLRK